MSASSQTASSTKKRGQRASGSQTGGQSPPSPAKNWHKKIAKNRGESWHRNMLAGRRDAFLNPSNIRLLRVKGDIHQDVVARKLDMSESTFGAIERGKRKVSGETAKAIAAILGVNVTKIFKFVRHDKYIAIVVKTAI